MDLRAELEVTEALAREAAAVELGYFRSAKLVVDEKPGEGPVTQADREANQLIVRGLRRHFPEDAILSEELPDDGSRWKCDRTWMVDPLDGTRDFVRGLGGFAVMIGLLVDGRPSLGVVVEPVSGVVFRATVGAGAERIDPDGNRQRLAVSAVDRLEEIRLVASRSHRSPSIDQVRSTLGIQDELNVGSVGLKLALLAQGLRDLYVNPESRTSLWDTLGPEVILTEAGGRVTDLEGQPLDYTGPSIKNRRGLIASNGRLHDRVIEKLRALFPSA